MLTGFFRQRPLVAEDFHAIDEIADAVGLGADQLRQRAIFVRKRRLQKLRRPTNTRQRVLDFVGQNRSHARHGARRGPMGELTLDHLRHVALLDHEQDVAGALGKRPGVHVDELRHQEFRGMHFDAVLVDGRTATGELDRAMGAADIRRPAVRPAFAASRTAMLKERKVSAAALA